MHRQGKTITVCWVPAHIGIPQNEQADQGARAAAIGEEVITCPRVHYRDYYPLLRRTIADRWQQMRDGIVSNKLKSIKTKTKCWESASNKNRRVEVILCRLRLGHARMTHGWILDRGQQPVCQHCSDPLSVRHILAECRHYTPLRNRLYPQTMQMDEQQTLKCMLAETGFSFDTDKIMCYLTETGLIVEI